jgi:hypothetical protein
MTDLNVSRRAVLGLAAAAGSTALLDPAAAQATSRFDRPAGLAGRALLPGDPGYAAETATYNLLETPRPGLVVAARSAADIRQAVRVAAAHHAPIGVMATGHQGSAPIGPDAVLVTTRAMRGVTVDADRRTARVEAGARWQDVLDKALPAGLAPLVGSTPTVGVVGYTLGGGLSPTLGRRYGFAADHVRSIDVVLADGRSRTVTGLSDPGLFFGLRGGKSNFGLVTAIEFDLFPVTTYYGGSILFAGRDAARLLHAYRTWVHTVPDEMSSSVALTNIPDLPGSPPQLRGKLVAALRICYTGRPQAGAALVKPLRAVATPIIDAVAEQPYSAFPAIHNDPVTPAPVYERTGMLRELPAAAVDALIAAAGPRAPYPVTLVEIRHLGGALAREARYPSAISTNQGSFTLFVANAAAPKDAAATVRGEDHIIRAMRPWSTGGAYINFMSPADASVQAVAHAYPPPVYRRLRALKRRVDPGNIFRLNHNIPPA